MTCYQRYCRVVLLLLSVECYITFCDSEIFYIVTSPSSPCPGEFTGVPCVTLEEYASNPSRSENIKFLVEPGTYNVSIVFAVSNTKSFTMSSTNATVMCTSTAAKFTFSTIKNVHISGITFQGCQSTAITMTNVTATITHTRCIENYQAKVYAGGCLDINSTSLTIIESEFLRNGAYTFNTAGAIYATSSTVTIQNSVFSYNGGSYANGGAIYCSASTLTIEGSAFRQNTVGYTGGGAIYSDKSIITLNKSSFEENSCGGSGNGGAIYMSGGTASFEQCLFSNNNAGSGGAVYKSGSIDDVVVIKKTSFNSNTANSFGGAVYIAGTNSSVSVSSSSFINNTAVQEGGGAIYSDARYANITLTSSTFTHNTASHCGVLDVANFDHFSVDLTNSVFTHNIATGQTIGGGVACIRNASINIINSSFKHNSANYHAGAFYIDESVTTVDASLFINNSAALDGGAFYTYVHESDYIIKRSKFILNKAGRDGGVILIGRLNCTVTISTSIFILNNAGERGGVVSIVASSLLMEINRAKIYNNTAQLGGVISACNSHVTLIGDSLNVTVDPDQPGCKLYDEKIDHLETTSPHDPKTAVVSRRLLLKRLQVFKKQSQLPKKRTV